MNAVGHSVTVFRRELAAYFNAAIAYIFIIVFVMLNCGLFMTQFFVVGMAEMRQFFTMLPFTLAVFLPAVTMRLWAEERRGNTLELLLTFPMATHELVVGKFIASFLFYLTALAGTFTLPIMLHVLGHPDLGQIASGYIGAALMGAFFLSIGIFISGLCRDQIVAFILAMIVCFGLYLAGTEFIATSIDGWFSGLGTFLRNFIGAAGHFDSFAKGVVDTRDVLYFVIGTVLFLVLNGFWLEGRMKSGAQNVFTIATIIAVAVFFTANWFVSGIQLGRFDLTEGKTYTISAASKKILRELKAPVVAKFYISPSDKMPTGMKTIEQDVIDKLDELRVSSHGNFDYKIFHMEAANVVDGAATSEQKADSLEQQMQKKGIQPFQVRAIESDEVAVKLVYSAISIGYKEKPEEIIPRIIPDNLNELEYRVVSKIFRMTLPESPKLALVAPYQEKNVDPQLQQLLAQLGKSVPDNYRDDNYELVPMALEYEGYEITRIKLNEKEPIPEGTKTLIIMEPEKLNDRQKYEINRFVRGGGSLFLAVQQYNYSYRPSNRNLDIIGENKDPQVNDLLQQWGLEVDDKVLADQQHDVINLSGGARMGPFEVSMPVKVPIQILVNESGMNKDVSITSRLSPVFYLWGTAIKLNDEKIKAQDLKVVTLLQSSDDSWTVPYTGSITPEGLKYKAGESRKGPFPLAVLVQGQFADAYEGKTRPDWPKEAGDTTPDKTPEEKAKVESPTSIAPAPGKIFLTGAVTPYQKTLLRSGGHLNLLLNAVDSLSLGDELIGIRSKRPIDRSLGRVSTPVKAGWRFFVTFLVPVLMATIGTVRVFLRKQSKTNYMKGLALAKA